MGVPKRKTSKRRNRVRVTANRWSAPQLHYCPQCGSAHERHCVCHSCGYYRGRQVLTINAG